MFTIRRIRVSLGMRAVVLRNELPVEVLTPGAYWRAGSFSVHWIALDGLCLEVRPEIRDAIPEDWYETVDLDANERAVVYREGVAARYLSAGTHYVLRDGARIRVERFDTRAAFPAERRGIGAVIPEGEVARVIIAPWQRGVRTEGGKVVDVLEPGQYAYWSRPDARVAVDLVDLRRQVLTITGQDLLTRDKVSLRVSLTLDYAIVDAVRSTLAVGSVRDALYNVAQVAVRAYLGRTTLDDALSDRDALTKALVDVVAPAAESMGARVERVDVKDIVLPAEMKVLLNRVIQAEKEAAANVILRREETAATRSLANTAKVMADNPVLLRLKELEALKEIAAEIGEVKLLVGADGLERYLPALRAAGGEQ